MDNSTKETGTKYVDIAKQKEENDRMLLAFEWIIGILSCCTLFIPIFIGALLPMESWQRIIIVFSGFAPAIVGFYFALKIEQMAGYYECKHCKHKHIPTYSAVSLAPHIGRTRYMKCPKCHKISWQKKVLKGD